MEPFKKKGRAVPVQVVPYCRTGRCNIGGHTHFFYCTNDLVHTGTLYLFKVIISHYLLLITPTSVKLRMLWLYDVIRDK
jgi:hypothetical protein